MKISHSFESEGACQFFFLTCNTFKGAVLFFFFKSEEDQEEAGLGLREACLVLCISIGRSSRSFAGLLKAQKTLRIHAEVVLA